MSNLSKAIGRGVVATGLIVSTPIAIFVVASHDLPKSNPQADLAVVFTGNNGRIAEALKIFKASCETSKQWLLMSGVYHSTKLSDLTEMNDVALPAECKLRVITGSFAQNTSGNAVETKAAITKLKNDFGYTVKSIQLMTSSCHMPRAFFETKAALDKDISIATKPVSHCGSSAFASAKAIIGEPYKFSFAAARPLHNVDYSKDGKWTANGQDVPKTLQRPLPLASLHRPLQL